MIQKNPYRFLNRQLDESQKDFDKRRDSIFDNTTDTIDYYRWTFSDCGWLSPEQCKDLEEAMECISAFGERGEQWYNEANEILRKNKENANEITAI